MDGSFSALESVEEFLLRILAGTKIWVEALTNDIVLVGILNKTSLNVSDGCELTTQLQRPVQITIYK